LIRGISSLPVGYVSRARLNILLRISDVAEFQAHHAPVRSCRQFSARRRERLRMIAFALVESTPCPVYPSHRYGLTCVTN